MTGKRRSRAMAPLVLLENVDGGRSKRFRGGSDRPVRRVSRTGKADARRLAVLPNKRDRNQKIRRGDVQPEFRWEFHQPPSSRRAPPSPKSRIRQSKTIRSDRTTLPC